MILRFQVSLRKVLLAIALSIILYLFSLCITSRTSVPINGIKGNTSSVKGGLKNHPESLSSCKNCLHSGLQKSAYSENVFFENDPLPEFWEPSPDLLKVFEERRNHVKKVCKAEKLNKRNSKNQPNAWEFLFNSEYGLIWCNIFKAASSTWFYNFNILAGYSEEFLVKTKETPTALARKKYPRLTVKELDNAFNSSTYSLSFMISRHPFERLVSAYRDKLESGSQFYRNLAKQIREAHPELQSSSPVTYVVQDTRYRYGEKSKSKTTTHTVPSFRQFVQFILDSHKEGKSLDQHWIPMYKFCTPCLVNFTIFAKQETLEEDGNYIIYKSGIKDVIHPKVVNRSMQEKTDRVASQYLCQLTREQVNGLVEMYRIDFELFEYSFAKYANCSEKM